MILEPQLTSLFQLFNIKSTCKVVITFFALLLGSNVIAQIDFLSVDDAFKLQAVEQLAEDTYRLSWEIEPGYYLYENRFWLRGHNKNDIAFRLTTQGKVKDDPNFGKVSVYYNTASIEFSLNHTDSVAENALKLGYQGCADGGLCYPPQTRDIWINSIQQESQKASNTPNTKRNQNSSDNEQNAIQKLLNNTSLTWLLVGFFILG